MTSQREDGRGHWPPGKRRNAVDPKKHQRVLQLLVSLHESSHREGPYSYAKVAAAIGVDGRTVRRWVSEEDVPTPENLAALEKYLKASRKFRLPRENHPNNL